MHTQPPTLPRWPRLLLPGRMVLFLLFQAVLATVFFLFKLPSPWESSAAWWPLTVSLVNILLLFLLTHLYRQEGRSYWSLFRFERLNVKSDLFLLLGFLVILGPVAMLPNQLLAQALFGDTQTPLKLFLAPLPTWAVYASMAAFPITQGLTELPFYFLYAMPRLAEQTKRPWFAYILACLFLGLQHLAVPLRFDARFIAWRALMFIPFAFGVGLLLKYRPKFLPYLAILHVLLDFSTTLMYFLP